MAKTKIRIQKIFRSEETAQEYAINLANHLGEKYEVLGYETEKFNNMLKGTCHYKVSMILSDYIVFEEICKSTDSAIHEIELTKKGYVTMKNYKHEVFHFSK